MVDRRLRVALHTVFAVAFWTAVFVAGCSGGTEGEGPILDGSIADTTTPFEAGGHETGPEAAGDAADAGDGDASTCPSGKTACSGACVDTTSDPKNCGVCGAVCAAPLVCGNSQCTITCPSGLTQCGGACVDLNKDFDHCGSCSTGCSPGQVCDQGSCKLYCGPPNTACNGVCVNTSQDGANCGTCGHKCPTGQVCSGGQCGVSCGLLTTCQGDAGAYCANTQSDQANCGSCGNACGQGQVCSNGGCAISCQPGQVNCGGSCIDPKTSPQFCGASGACGAGGNGSPGATCGQGQVCAAGTCATSCPPGEVLCGGLCIDPTSSVAYCGATAGCGVNGVGSAGFKCVSGQVCSNGSCTATCVPGQLVCPVNGVPTCVNPLTDDTYCGANAPCQGFKTCQSGQVCSNGACTATCAPNLALCSGQCTDPKTSPAHCGAAAGGQCNSPTATDPNYQGQACGPLTQCGPNAGGTTFSCKSTCTGGGSQCFPNGGTPYCANLLTDNNNCGTCGTKCGALHTCDGTGHCASTCASGQSPCPAASAPNPTAPYCAELQTDNANCGTCNHVCGTNQVCSSGTCGSICGTGQTFCTQTGVPYCALTQTDPNNCGGCGNVCAGSCVTGQCCPSGSNAICGGTCTNTDKDVSNCGSCGHACDASAPFCIGGTCQATLYATADLFAPKKLIFLFAPAGTTFSSNADYAAFCAAHGFTQNQNVDTHAEYVQAGMQNSNAFYCGGFCCYLGSGNDRSKNFLSFVNNNLPLNTPLRVFDRGCGDYNCNPGNPGSFTTGLNTTDQLVVTGATTFTYTDDFYGTHDYCSTKSTTLPVDGVVVCETN
jgi:hypothetical protein